MIRPEAIGAIAVRIRYDRRGARSEQWRGPARWTSGKRPRALFWGDNRPARRITPSFVLEGIQVELDVLAENGCAHVHLWNGWHAQYHPFWTRAPVLRCRICDEYLLATRVAQTNYPTSFVLASGPQH